ncbi:hypothetical protein CUZ95_1939 [Enterococcus lactis]|nr:hypothetical protein [Enterococcus lactis]
MRTSLLWNIFSHLAIKKRYRIVEIGTKNIKQTNDVPFAA